MAYIFLIVAVFLEVLGSIMTYYTDGFTALLPTAIVIISILSSYFFFSRNQKHGMEIGKGYALWAGLGVFLVTVIGIVLLDEVLTHLQIAGVLLVIGGLTALQLGGTPKSIK